MKIKMVYVLAFCLIQQVACQISNQKQQAQALNDGVAVLNKDSIILIPDRVIPIAYSEVEWKQKLEPLAYNVLREKGTERAYSGLYWDNHQNGVYLCNACTLPLFESHQKFDSGTGWPSFLKPIRSYLVTEIQDNEFGMTRTEVLCARCKGHLGHVFNDGPQPTGLRYCMNSVSLKFIPNALIK